MLTSVQAVEDDGACPIIRSYVTHLKSFLPPSELNQLYMREASVRKSKSTLKIEHDRAKQLLEHITRHCLPEAFSMFGLPDGSAQLRGLPSLTRAAALDAYCDALRHLNDRKWDCPQSGKTLLRDSLLTPLRDTEKAIHLLKQGNPTPVGKLLAPIVERLGRADAFMPLLDAMLSEGTVKAKAPLLAVVGAKVTKAELVWAEPPTAAKLTELRRDLHPLLVGEVLPAIQAAWNVDSGPGEVKVLERQVRAGVRQGLKELTMPFRTEQLDARLGLSLNGVPLDWTPPQANIEEPAWSVHQLRAYRWAASGLALVIRNELKDIPAEQCSDDHLRKLNQRIRDAVYQVLLANAALAWRLTDYPRAFLQMHEAGIPGVRVPMAVG